MIDAAVYPRLTRFSQYTTLTDIPRISHIPEIPGAIPLFGHLFQLGDDHATVCEAWWRRYRWPIFQIRLGNTRAVVVNSFDTAKQMLIGHQSAVVDRPTLYTFHGVISSTQGFTIGSSPWDESCKARRKAAGKTLGRPNVNGMCGEMFDLETGCIVRDLWKNGCSPSIQKESIDREGVQIDIRPFFQRFALNTTLTLCYGIRMDDIYDEMLREILYVGSAISLLRSASENYQDYVPILRWWPRNEKTSRSKQLRIRRDKYLDELLDKVERMVKTGTDKPCVASAIMKDEETKLNNVELSSICLSLVSGGFETIPGTLTSCVGSLCTSDGRVWQERAYRDILRIHGNDSLNKIWEDSFTEEKIPYINAIVKEAGRYYTVSSMSLPRKTLTEVRWKNEDGSIAIIPPKTMVLINAQAANHDVDHFGPDAGMFNPERWLTQESGTVDEKSSKFPIWQEKPSEGIPHFSFGAGSRACSGQIIAQRLLYAALVRLLSSFEIIASEEEPPNTDYVEYNAIKTALVAIPRDFKVKLVPRKGADIEGVLKTWDERTKMFYAED